MRSSVRMRCCYCAPSVCAKDSVCLLYWYKSTNTDADGATAIALDVFYAESSRAAQRVGGKKKKEKDADAALGGLQEQGHHEFCGPRKPFDDLAMLLGNGSLALVQTKASEASKVS